eukprot:CAMPEP_0201522174 /NCGR_PEP_ID=MMETSP0161_2-20130828/16500_1 /ASSEMBLY_ACC=CAM_ASM_000251 /TAXON_ID=180227 /ORGANISM="Neoparamoeba aestuarina, Strain SoJaBio B1-5/56/2" /LENGTH=58 /DNA_ID=CAMNT_0047920945 /DNA_START=85 /DNA_END=261 /DNA_ORIENTATION=-
MKTLDLCHNPLTGETDFRQLPAKLRYLGIQKTQLAGVIVYEKTRTVQYGQSMVKMVKK